MKKTTILLVATMTISYTNAQKIQDKGLPVTVKTSLQEKYPTAKSLKWEKENSYYEAEFEVEKTSYSVLMDASGNIIETKVEIDIDILPVSVKYYISKKHSNQKIKEAAKITDSKEVITYEVEIKGKDLTFDSNGNFIKEETENDND